MIFILCITSHIGASCWARCLSLLHFHLVFLSMCCPGAILGLLEFSLFCCATSWHCIRSVRNFNFCLGYREIILFVTISCAGFFCAQQHCLDIAHVKFPLAFCAEFWRPIPLSFLSKFNSVLPILLFIWATL